MLLDLIVMIKSEHIGGHFAVDEFPGGAKNRWLSASWAVTVRLWCVVSSPLILGFVPLSVDALLGEPVTD